VRDIRLDGLTPPLTLVRAIAAEVRLPLRVMVRENAGYGTDPAELVRMCRAATAFAALGVDGVVVGFARDGQLLPNELKEVLQAAPQLAATFHRAFDSLTDPIGALDVLQGIPQIDRVLTDGVDRRAALYEAPDRPRPAPPRRLAEYVAHAGRLRIVAGGGLDEASIAELARTRAVSEVHVGRSARDGVNRESPVTAARVRRLRETLLAFK
jgi:copper homeostasis protein